MSVIACLAIFAFLLYVISRLLSHHRVPAIPSMFHGDSEFVRKTLEQCPILYKVYDPPSTWGRSGHLQTFVYSVLGRVKSPFPRGERRSIQMTDGATLTFDVFPALAKHRCEGDYTVICVPGLGNSSESIYIRTFVNFMQNSGYRVAVLNHLGALKTEKITAPRLFTYGGTEELRKMIQTVMALFPGTVLLGVGFSMGANILCKYLGENDKLAKRFLCAMSICQGYDAVKAVGLLMRWENLRRGYIWAMTENMKKILRRHEDVMNSEEARQRCPSIDISHALASTSLVSFDEHFTRRLAGCDSLIDYYRDHSCSRVIHNISVPLMLVNAEDDPIVPAELHSCAYEYVENHDHSIFVLTRHGGHLGFYEGSLLYPLPITWIDKVILQYCDANIQLKKAEKTRH